MIRWYEMAQQLLDLQIDPFEQMDAFLQSIGLDLRFANDQFLYDYYSAECIDDDPHRIPVIIYNAFIQNLTKYNAIKENFPFSKRKQTIRSPDIEKITSGESGTTVTTERKQHEITTETPQNYRETRERSVNPFDNTGYKTESKDEISETGSRQTETSYSGNPDETISSSEGSRTETETGTETVIETVIGSERLTMAESMQDMSAALSLWGIIEADIAKKLFLQIWR